ncbi:MAG: hypothetical protein U0353_10975 [Sandaracinus sp.]
MQYEDGLGAHHRACANVSFDFAPIAQRVYDILDRTGNGHDSPRKAEFVFDSRRDEPLDARLRGRWRPTQGRDGRNRREFLEAGCDPGLRGERFAATVPACKRQK